MRPSRNLLLVASVLSVGFSTVSPTAQANGLEPVQSLQTPAGQSYTFRPIKDAKRLAIAIRWPTDVVNVPRGMDALPHIANQLMFWGGADGRSSADLKSEFKDLDADIRIQPRPDLTGLSFIAPGATAIEAAKLTNLLLTKPDFSANWLKRIKSNMLKSHEQGMRFAATKLAIAARSYSLGNHPYARTPPFASRSTIETVTREAIRTWHRYVFTKKDLRISASGHGTPDQIGKVIDELLKGLPTEYVKQPKRSSVPNFRHDGKTIVVADPSARKSIIMMFGDMKWQKDLTDSEMKIAVDILGRGAQSRLFKTLRSELGLSYGAAARSQFIRSERHILTIRSEVNADKIGEAVAALRETYANFIRHGVTQKEFAAHRERAIQSLEQKMKQPIASATMTLSTLAAGYSEKFIGQISRHLQSSTPEDLNRLIKSNMPTLQKTLTVVVTANPDQISADCVVKALEQIERCPSR